MLLSESETGSRPSHVLSSGVCLFSEVKLSLASCLSDRIVDEILESLSRSQHTLVSLRLSVGLSLLHLSPHPSVLPPSPGRPSEQEGSSSAASRASHGGRGSGRDGSAAGEPEPGAGTQTTEEARAAGRGHVHGRRQRVDGQGH